MRFFVASIVTLAICFSVCNSANANNNHKHGPASSSSASSLPDWRLTKASHDVISSDQFAGRPYVLILHLGKGCLHCAEQLQAFGASADDFANAGVEVVGVSTDGVEQLADQLKAFGDSFSLRHLASDKELKLFRDVGAFDAIKEEPLHATFLVDAAGRIRWSKIGGDPFMDVERLVAEAQLVSAGSTTTQEDENPKAPKILLDKSARIVAYQLKRLSNAQLLLVSRKTDDKKYAPVWLAILTRSGMDRPYRKEALDALVKLNESTAANELITALGGMRSATDVEKRDCRELANMLMRLDSNDLAAVETRLVDSTAAENEVLAQASFASLVSAGKTEKAIETSELDDEHMVNWLRSIGMMRSAEARNELRDAVFAKVGDTFGQPVRKEAILAMKHFSAAQKETWSALASMVIKGSFPNPAVKTLLALPVEARDSTLSDDVVESLLKRAEAMPDAKRTNPSALLAMELADELISESNDEKAIAFRKRMGAVSVRVVRIKTIKEEMRYDVPYFAAQAGRPIQIVLDNEDLMPHNLIVCKPGKLKQVAIDGLAVGPQNGLDGKQYVPKTKDVLFATDMVQSNEKARLTFKAPKSAGEYPFVCTFPQHWSRMYGVMVVVDDLAAWEKNPVQPKDPIGNQRKLVKKWTVDDFSEQLKEDLTSRSLESGKRIFTEATCAQCHRLGEIGGTGANVGPELDELYKRWEGDRGKAMKQIFDPSSHVDPKFKMHLIATDDGLTRTGLIVSQDDEKIELLESGSVDKTTTILKEEIEEMAESKKSMMPKALLDNFTKEEILDLMHYLESNQK